METGTKTEKLLKIIQSLADEQPIFFEVKGEGAGNLDTNRFMSEVRRAALMAFDYDHSEKRICGNSSHAVDFYFEAEATIVEIALGIYLPNSEFEKDIFKALLAQELSPVRRLVLVGKPSAVRVCARPGRTAVIDWALRRHGLQVEVFEIANKHR